MGVAETTRRLAQKQPSLKECVIGHWSKVTPRRQCNGAKPATEAADVVISHVVGERCNNSEGRLVRAAGVVARENAGMSSELPVRTWHTVNPRVPKQGQSA